MFPPLVWLGAAVFRAVIQHGFGFPDGTARRVLGQSLALGLSASAIATGLGATYGWLVGRYALPGRPLFRVAALGPLLVPPYASSLAWFILLAPDGWLNSHLLAWGVLQHPLHPFRSFWLAAWVLGASYWPVIGYLTLLAARSVPRDLDDAPRLHTVAGKAALWAAGPGLQAAVPAGALMVFLLALADFGVPISISLPTYPVEIVNRFMFDHDAGMVARLAVPLLALVVPAVWLQLRLLRRLPQASGAADDLPAVGSRAQGLWGATWCGLVLAASMLLPLAVLFAASLPLETYPAVWAESSEHFWNTLISAGGGAALTLALALLLGWLSRRKLPGALDFVFVLPYALPASLIGVAMIQILNQRGPIGDLYNSVGSLVWTYAALFFPFAHKSLQPAWDRLDRELEEDSAVQGAGSWVLFRTTAWPVVRGNAWLAAGLVALLAAREVDATALLRVPGGDTLAFRIQDYLHFAPTPKVAALCIWVVTLSGLVAGGLAFLLRRRE